MPQMAFSSPSVFMLFRQYLFKQHILQLKMSCGNLILGNSFPPILSLAPLFINLGWDAGFRADKNAFAVNLIILPGETFDIPPEHLLLVSRLPFTSVYLLDFVLVEIPGQKRQGTLPITEHP